MFWPFKIFKYVDGACKFPAVNFRNYSFPSLQLIETLIIEHIEYV